MENESWLDFMLQPISLGAEDAELPKQQLYKDISELRIQPDEGTTNHENRNQFTFTNRNLDIIQNLHEAYIEYTCVFSTPGLAENRTAVQDEHIINEFFHDNAGDMEFPTTSNGVQLQQNKYAPTHLTSVDANRIRFKQVQGKTYSSIGNTNVGATADEKYEFLHVVPYYTKGFYALCLPQTAFWIDGYTFELNDTTVSTQNSGLARSLNVLNHGVYAKESRQLSLYGMTNDVNIKSPFEIQKYKLVNGDLRLKVPLKYIIPYLSQNKVSWGVKTSLKLTKLNKDAIKHMFNHVPGDSLAHFDVDIKDIELVVPYVKLENNKQLSLWNQMYSSVNNRYWLENDHFTSQVYDNRISHTNEVYRIATKGLNSRPRWLLLSACDPDIDKTTPEVPYDRNAMTPMGFEDRSANWANEGTAINELKFTKIRVKINGIYIDGGDVLEFQNKATETTSDYKTMGKMTYGGDYFLAYENYCKFFGSYHSKRGTPKDFEQWLESQVFCFDLVNIDSENIFANSGNALIIEVEFSTVAGSNSGQGSLYNFKLVANVLYDKQLSISHSNNSAILTIT